MPAALAIAPVQGGAVVKTSAVSPAPVGDDAFGQVLRSVQDVAPDQVAATPVGADANVVPPVDAGNEAAPILMEPPALAPGAPSMARDPVAGTKPVRMSKDDKQPADSKESAVASDPAASVSPLPAPVVVPLVPVPVVSAPALPVSSPPSDPAPSVAPQSAAASRARAGPPENPVPDTNPVAAEPDPLPQAAVAPAPPDGGVAPALPKMMVEVPVPSVAPAMVRKNAAFDIPTDAPPRHAADAASPDLVSPTVTLTPVATTTVSPPVATAHPTGVAAPVAQIAPALLALAKTADGNQQMTVRLQPDELGMVQIRIERAPSGATQVEITAEKSDTLQALQRDQPQLHHMLDVAGIPSAGRTVTFHAAQPAQASAGGNASGQSAGQGPSSGRMNGGSPDAGGSPGGGKSGYQAREAAWAGSRRQGGLAVAAASNPTAIGHTYRVGLDITA